MIVYDVIERRAVVAGFLRGGMEPCGGRRHRELTDTYSPAAIDLAPACRGPDLNPFAGVTR
ncbi:MAG: hypothetical protein HOP16_01475 [Acidobacteria bacterium]|nr:hypothetical protein [Acidobacteriota bacterium]